MNKDLPNEIGSFMTCKECFESLPNGVSPREWGRIEVGYTPKGIQVWCVRHERNVLHLDFLGQKMAYADMDVNEHGFQVPKGEK